VLHTVVVGARAFIPHPAERARDQTRLESVACTVLASMLCMYSTGAYNSNCKTA
jgi:hypothetical protein